MSSVINDILQGLSGTLYGSANVGGNIIYQHKHDRIVKNYYENLGEFHKREGHKNSWVKFGNDDMTPDRIEEFYRMSGVHNSALNWKTNLIRGGDFDISIPDMICKKNKDGVFELVPSGIPESGKANEIEKVKLWLKNVGAMRYKNQAASQLALFGGYFGLRFFALDEKGQTYLRHIHIEGNRVARLGSDREHCGEGIVSKKLYVNSSFNKANVNRVVDYSDYTPKHKKDKYTKSVLRDDGLMIEGNIMDAEESLKDTKKKKFGVRYKMVGDLDPNYRSVYPTPDYESKKFFEDCNTDYLLSVKNSKDAADGFTLKFIIVRNRKPLPNEAEEKAEKANDLNLIRDNYKGAFGGDSLMLWVEPAVDDAGKPIIVPPVSIIEIPHNDSFEKVAKSREDAVTGILSGHGIAASEMVGLPAERGRGFSNISEFLITAVNQIHFARVVHPQRMMSEDLTEMAIMSGLMCNIKVKPSKPALRQFTDDLLRTVMTSEEIRDELGRQPLTEQQKAEIAENVLVSLGKSKADEVEPEKTEQKNDLNG